MSLARANQRREPEFRGYDPATKALVDRVGAFVLLVVTVPLCALIALAVWLDSDGPVLSRDRRVGRWGAEFDLLRFRSTVAPPSPDATSSRDAGDRPLSRVGRFLRRYSLDELPQLINVLRGDMSFVGPRPVAPAELGRGATELPRLLLRPGLTGLSPIAEEAGHDRDASAALDRYLQDWSLALDLAIVRRSVRGALRGLDPGPRTGPEHS